MRSVPGPKPPLILALDIGTSSTRSAIFDGSGRRLAATTAQVVYPLITDAGGRAELRPDDLDHAVTRALGQTLSAWRKTSSPLAAIGVSCFWHSLLGLDEAGRALTPIYTWADSRCRHDAEMLRQKLGEKAIHARTGCMARASYWPAKLLWLRRTQPRLVRRVARWVSPAEWLQQRWCGTATVSLSMASGTGLLDARTLRWDRALLRHCGLNERRLSAISDEPARVAGIHARRFRELSGVPWHPALGDGAASNLGSGAVSPGVAAINVGTSAALRVVINEGKIRRAPRTPLGLFSYRVDARRRLLGGAISNAGNLHAWALRELRLPGDPAAVEKLLRMRPRPAEHLTVLPFWVAERAPTWQEDVPSAVVGITQATTALDLLQAIQEASYHRLAQIAKETERAVGRRLAFIVSGGIRHSSDALQRLADVLGRPIYISDEPEASLRGAACFVLDRLGIRIPPLRPGKAIRPRRAASRAYARARSAQIQLEKLLQNGL